MHCFDVEYVAKVGHLEETRRGSCPGIYKRYIEFYFEIKNILRRVLFG